jgi:hypothetical protein
VKTAPPVHVWRERIDDNEFAACACCLVRGGRYLWGGASFILLPMKYWRGWEWQDHARKHFEYILPQLCHGRAFRFVGGVRLPYVRSLLSDEPY